MEFKAFLFSFSLFVIAASGASLSKCGEDQKKDSISEYTIKVHNGRKEIDENITIDTENETETFHIEDDDTGNIDVLLDFKRNLSMYRISECCLLSNSTDRQPKPGDLIKELQSYAQQGPTPEKPKETIVYALGDPVDDRSFLTDEMANMCAKVPIYYLVPQMVTVDVQGQKIAKRKKRVSPVVVVLVVVIILIPTDVH